jgi:pantoate ligase / CMP/dCMP kinase
LKVGNWRSGIGSWELVIGNRPRREFLTHYPPAIWLQNLHDLTSPPAKTSRQEAVGFCTLLSGGLRQILGERSVRLFTTIAGLRCYLDLKRSEQPIPANSDFADTTQPSIGLVPTMGALHAGHLSLIAQARQDNDLVVVSIFVNPLQFGPNEDFQHYPRTLEHDRELCRQAGVDVIFAPTAAELYGQEKLGIRDWRINSPFSVSTAHPVADSVSQVTPPPAMMAELCGRFRPGHFSGVATVVTKLLSIVQPDRAYFGQKDAQQLAILKRIVADLNLPVQMIGCPIVREASGLAMSSRNQYLSEAERQQSAALYRGLREELIDVVKAELMSVSAVHPQYIELVHPDTLAPLEQVEDCGLLAVAAFVGSTRLIDNVVLWNRKPILAIDGPAGAGKSTVARQVAQTLGLLYLDTGAMYRAVTWMVLQSGLAVTDQAAIAELVSQCDIVLASEVPEGNPSGNGQAAESTLPRPTVWINGHNVTQAIRSLEVTAQVSTIAAQPVVRQELVRRQQAYGRRGGIVMDGRDIGTHVFPDAELKIFLTASVQERARRRQQELQGHNQLQLSLSALEQTIRDRDSKDSSRRIAPLRKAADAVEIQTDNLSIDEVTTKIINLYQEKLARLCSHQV